MGIDDTLSLLRDAGTRFRYHTVNGKTYVILKGRPALRAVLRGTRYAASTLSTITKTREVATAVKSNFTPASLGKTVLFIAPVEIYEAIRDDKSMGEFVAGMVVAIGSGVAAATISSAITSGLLTALGVSAAGGPVGVVLGVGIAVAVLVGAGIAWLDQKYCVSEAAEAQGKKWQTQIGEWWEGNVTRPMAQTLYELEREIMHLYGVPGL